MKWYADVDPDTFFPKCYNLADDEMFEEFIEEFKVIKAECILKKFLHSLKSNSSSFDLKMLDTALLVSKRRLLSVDEFIENP